MMLLGIVMVGVQLVWGDVPAWVLCSNWCLAGVTAYILWDSVDRYRLGRTVKRGTMIVPWILLVAMGNLCGEVFNDRLMVVENYLALGCFLVLVRHSMHLWQNPYPVGQLVLMGMLVGASSALFPGSLLWTLLLPFQLFFMRCSHLRNYLASLSGVVLGVWCAFCVLFFWGDENSLPALLERYLSLMEFDRNDLGIEGFWQYLTIGVVLGLTVFYSLATLLLNVSNTLRALSINRLLTVFQVMVLLFTLLDMAHLPLYLVLQTLVLGLQLVVILANSRSYLPEWWTLLLMLMYMALGVAPYVPKEWFPPLFTVP